MDVVGCQVDTGSSLGSEPIMSVTIYLVPISHESIDLGHHIHLDQGHQLLAPLQYGRDHSKSVYREGFQLKSSFPPLLMCQIFALANPVFPRAPYLDLFGTAAGRA